MSETSVSKSGTAWRVRSDYAELIYEPKKAELAVVDRRSGTRWV